MVKFIFISLAIWFVITRLMRFKFVVYRGNPMHNDNRYHQNQKPEGSITIDNLNSRPRNDKNVADEEYIDFEEVK
ncbi:MAG TPA: hypothetical protein DCR46_08550 [Cytophagales bacterium]|jgi:hypothetical protein|nr:hypothetical protein [Cytophagales bacterium]